MRSFASDNNSGVHPRIMHALASANKGHVLGYGNDSYTQKAQDDLRAVFGQDIDTYFVYLGTAANVLSIKALTKSYHSVFCADSAHINVDECGAPEQFSNCKLIPLPTDNGKISIDSIKPHLHVIGDEHHSQPRLISITQCTELGTVYAPAEVRALADFAHAHNMLLHMDGARLANACAYLNFGLRQATRDLGVDVLSFGGTKNGLMFGEGILFFNADLSQDFKYVRKQGMQLASKMRFISVQFSELLKDDLWQENAQHANAMAALLAELAANVPGVSLTRPVQTNHVFATLPPHAITTMQEKYFFYEWNPEQHEVRWVCSFDTSEDDVRSFVKTLQQAL